MEGIKKHTWDEVRNMSKDQFNELLEEIRKRLNYHKYQMGELMQMGENSYYVKVGPLKRSEFTDGERMLAWYIHNHGAPEGFTPATKSVVKKFQPTF